MLRVKDVAEQLGVTQHTVLAWIQSGELRAVDVSRQRGGKPSWRIDPDELEAFRISRTPMPTTPRGSSRRRKQEALDEVGYY